MPGFRKRFEKIRRIFKSLEEGSKHPAEDSSRIGEPLLGVLEREQYLRSHNHQHAEHARDHAQFDPPSYGERVEVRTFNEEEISEMEDPTSASAGYQNNSYVPPVSPLGEDYSPPYFGDFYDNPALAQEGSDSPPSISPVRTPSPPSYEYVEMLTSTLVNLPVDPDVRVLIERQERRERERTRELQCQQYRLDKHAPRPENLNCKAAYRQRLIVSDKLWIEVAGQGRHSREPSKPRRSALPKPPMVTSSVSVTPPRLCLNFEPPAPQAKDRFPLFFDPVPNFSKPLPRSQSGVHQSISYPRPGPFRSFHTPQTPEDEVELPSPTAQYHSALLQIQRRQLSESQLIHHIERAREERRGGTEGERRVRPETAAELHPNPLMSSPPNAFSTRHVPAPDRGDDVDVLRTGRYVAYTLVVDVPQEQGVQGRVDYFEGVQGRRGRSASQSSELFF